MFGEAEIPSKEKSEERRTRNKRKSWRGERIGALRGGNANANYGRDGINALAYSLYTLDY